MPRERATEIERAGRKREREKKEGTSLALLWKSIEESSESASPGQRLCHLIGYVEQFILFFPIPRGRGATGEELPKERQSATLFHLPATLRTRRRHFPISRQASAPVLVHSSPYPQLPLVSSRFFVLFSRRKRKWKRGTKREKGKKGAERVAWRRVAQPEVEHESEKLRLASAVTREPSKVG
ncbi:hypothetical protein PUN28_002851 [Cardiocondyla obscurior]|uniref:Uncharacterized protein n=1 Tax=Cardiocondyla obscurior TaxID=286306 RepID=A0AAW2GWL5_9HYME